ncbi:type VI secretion protein [Vibrio sp. MACH09]|uniref:type VI secretion system baseplate subunit TssK n=1 Tax=unclassified Vibrio TaxID=2614977 RepID=UPI001493AEAD|nr:MULTISPECIES: type VI secretion system baseplate subunit TssK [unclassified Vibrio]NOI64722.1 type VI secretion system baseplate subunit TssK [Vibrio sp. 99-8-1]GLO63066.1 type VI secretion protein [Vibrio sp. MACH09]
MDNKKVVWSEGMFLSPQHFQQQERYLENYVREFSEQSGTMAFGFSLLDIDTALLKIGKFGIKHARGRFPDGTPFELQQALVIDIPQGFINQRVYLALPVYRSGAVDVGDDDRLRNKPSETSVFDTSRDRSEPVQLDVANLNVTLKLEGEELEDYTLIPVAQVSEHKSEGTVLLNKAFVPNCLHFGASSYLVESLSDIHAQMQYRANTIAVRLNAESQSKSYQSLIRDYLWMQALGGWLPKLKLWVDGELIATRDLYFECISMVGQMAGLEGKMPKEVLAWNPNELYKIFSHVFSEMMLQLREVQLDNVTNLKWDTNLFATRRLLRTLIKERSLFNNGRFVLVVTSSLGSAKLGEQFPFAAKLAGNSAIAELVRNALSGVPLLPLPYAPSELKSRHDAAYFELDTQSELWKALVKKDEPIALHIDDRIGDVQVEFYVIR